MKQKTELIPFNIDTPEGCELVKEVNTALERLEQNADFQLFINAYTKNFLLDKASLMATANKTFIDRTILMELQISVANFIDFMMLVHSFSNKLKEDAQAKYEDKKAETKKQIDSNKPVEL